MAKPGPGKTRRTIRRKADEACDAAAEERDETGETCRTDRICDLFVTLSNPLVFDLLRVLAEKEATIEELSLATGRPSTLVSMYLSDLRRRGIAERDDQAKPPAYRFKDADAKAIVLAAKADRNFTGLA